VIERVDDRGGAVTKVELGEDVADVRLDRDLGDAEVDADLGVRPAARSEAQPVELTRRAPALSLAVAVPVVTWTGWFVTYHAVWGLGWSAELISGTVVFTALTSVALRGLTTASAGRAT
jgi:hypothetical protein